MFFAVEKFHGLILLPRFLFFSSALLGRMLMHVVLCLT